MVPESVPDVSTTYRAWSKLAFHELAFEAPLGRPAGP